MSRQNTFAVTVKKNKKNMKGKQTYNSTNDGGATMNVFRLVNWSGQFNAVKKVQPYNQPKHENTLARLIE